MEGRSTIYVTANQPSIIATFAENSNILIIIKNAYNVNNINISVGVTTEQIHDTINVKVMIIKAVTRP